MENKRLAINAGVTLSSNLISACLAMLAIIGALFTFIIDKREVGFWFWLFITLSFCSFVVSIILGGKGIDAVRKSAFNGMLDLHCSKNKFNFQAITCLAGLFFCILSILFTREKIENNIHLENINTNFNKLIELEKSRNHENYLLREKLEEMGVRLESLETQMQSECPKQ